MNRRLALLLTVPLLTSCTVEDVAATFGPRPDAQVAALADRAASDAAALSGEEAELRARHAGELGDEIARLCGTHADGTVPESCAFEPEVTALPQVSIDDSLALTLGADLPAESHALAVRQAVDMAAVSPADLPARLDPSPDSGAADAARELLAREYATAWGLGVARARLDPARQEAVDELLDAHESRIRILREVLEPFGEVPVAEPGYELEGLDEPVDAATAEDFVTRVEESLAGAWLAAAAEAAPGAWQEFAVRGTAEVETALGSYSAG
ncbi:DUF4439 domain-containing protein [Corynebacterium marinum]|uniref:Putative secreted protein n=1 Tax=Corynebacterium marinum DSM 44953 TaxID=1224162 RepID=A0A0B6TWK6_9CORY|nr:DUF4439 domain-containing protein [Corynebacterium marinum]AJK69131.1 putative secreted protein [Corynebacterium marinum DSM 44953]GGO17555.1 hypothetical protein GCM10010980_14890 [Corynebacterium marinum]